MGDKPTFGIPQESFPIQRYARAVIVSIYMAGHGEEIEYQKDVRNRFFLHVMLN